MSSSELSSGPHVAPAASGVAAEKSSTISSSELTSGAERAGARAARAAAAAERVSMLWLDMGVAAGELCRRGGRDRAKRRQDSVRQGQAVTPSLAMAHCLREPVTACKMQASITPFFLHVCE